jgi:multimeric flavodoxin WrbA
MKAIAIVGSPRSGGNTEILARRALKVIEGEGLYTELISLASLEIKPCTACLVCKKEDRCPIEDDLWPVYMKMRESDAILLASPVYVGSATAQIKALMDRTAYMAYAGRLFAGKVGGALAVGERAGQNFTLAQLTYWFHTMGCLMMGSAHWNIAFGMEKGDVQKDKEGLKAASELGRNVAILCKFKAETRHIEGLA